MSVKETSVPCETMTMENTFQSHTSRRFGIPKFQPTRKMLP